MKFELTSKSTKCFPEMTQTWIMKSRLLSSIIIGWFWLWYNRKVLTTRAYSIGENTYHKWAPLSNILWINSVGLAGKGRLYVGQLGVLSRPEEWQQLTNIKISRVGKRTSIATLYNSQLPIASGQPTTSSWIPNALDLERKQARCPLIHLHSNCSFYRRLIMVPLTGRPCVQASLKTAVVRLRERG